MNEFISPGRIRLIGPTTSSLVTFFSDFWPSDPQTPPIPTPRHISQPRLSLRQACLKANFSKCSASHLQRLKPGLSTRGCTMLVLIILFGLLVCFSCLCSIQTACACRKLDRCSHRSQVRAPPVPVLCC